MATSRENTGFKHSPVPDRIQALQLESGRPMSPRATSREGEVKLLILCDDSIYVKTRGNKLLSSPELSSAINATKPARKEAGIAYTSTFELPTISRGDRCTDFTMAYSRFRGVVYLDTLGEVIAFDYVNKIPPCISTRSSSGFMLTSTLLARDFRNIFSAADVSKLNVLYGRNICVSGESEN